MRPVRPSVTVDARRSSITIAYLATLDVGPGALALHQTQGFAQHHGLDRSGVSLDVAERPHRSVLVGAFDRRYVPQRGRAVDVDVVADRGAFDGHGRDGEIPTGAGHSDQHVVGYEHVGEEYFVKVEVSAGLLDRLDGRYRAMLMSRRK